MNREKHEQAKERRGYEMRHWAAYPSRKYQENIEYAGIFWRICIPAVLSIFLEVYIFFVGVVVLWDGGLTHILYICTFATMLMCLRLKITPFNAGAFLLLFVTSYFLLLLWFLICTSKFLSLVTSTSSQSKILICSKRLFIGCWVEDLLILLESLFCILEVFPGYIFATNESDIAVSLGHLRCPR